MPKVKAGPVVFFQAEVGIRDTSVTGVQTCALPISRRAGGPRPRRADQRAGPGRHPLAAPAPAGARRRRPDRGHVEPRARRGRADRRRGARPRPGPAARALGHGGRRLARGRLPRAHGLGRGGLVKPLVAAELLRLRTMRGPRWMAVGGLVLVAFVAVSNLRSDAHLGPHELADVMRALAVTCVLLPAVFAASTVGAAFQRGE